ncbi:hypothetical protein [Marinobacter changyiensis]|uniref:hypothetical protein n=1 Tax=Marinobacter changyiensis TaxID=2604091 RepID=UPI0015D3D66C|nr:hypothetical protein [Marinobacter changyiensis]
MDDVPLEVTGAIKVGQVGLLQHAVAHNNEVKSTGFWFGIIDDVACLNLETRILA